ncbi:MAG: tetratricopeptide repeat protein [Candidatus Limnocylindria bacterium]
MRSRRIWLIPAAVVVVLIGVLAGSRIIELATGTAPAAERLRAAASLRPFSDTDQSVDDLEDVVEARGADSTARAQLGAGYLQLARETGDPGYYARAESVFDEALKVDPNNIDALIGQGSLALSRHEFDDALELGERALAINDSVPRAYGIIGDAQVELGRYDDAVATIQSMVDLRPDLASFSRVSYLRELHGDLPGAIDAMERALSAGGPSAENTEFVRVQLGNLHFTSGDLGTAERLYREALARLPDYVYALAGLARVSAAEGRFDDAIGLYRQATTRLPLPELVIGLGETLEAAGRQEEASDEYALVQAMQQLYAANGVRTDLELAAFSADHGDAEVALDLARAAHETQPNVRAADTLAWALYRSGDPEAAWPMVEEALRLGTRDPRMQYHAGVIASALGRDDEARQHLAAALELNDRFSPLDGPRAAEALAELGPDR